MDAKGSEEGKRWMRTGEEQRQEQEHEKRVEEQGGARWKAENRVEPLGTSWEIFWLSWPVCRLRSLYVGWVHVLGPSTGRNMALHWGPVQ